MVAHTFNPSIPAAEAGGSLTLRQARSTDLVSGQLNLDSEGIHQKQKVGEDVIE